MENWARFFAYSTGVLVIGLAIIVFTETFLTYIEVPGWPGYVTLLAYGLVYLNFSYGVNRRFVTKKRREINLAYLLGFLLFLPPAVWVYVKDVGLYDQRPLFLAVLFFACLLGAYFGIRSGLSRREAYFEKLRQYREQLPDDLKKSHEHLNKN